MGALGFGVYIHIPFCRKRCTYCDYVSNALHGPLPESFLPAMLREIECFEYDATARSIFFGGGTPSLLSNASLERLLNVLHRRFVFSTPEITLEVNPDDVTHEAAQSWRALGINRVSLGVQSFNDAVLRFMGRRHDAAGARRATDVIAQLFDNWSMDLIYGAPRERRWGDTLRVALESEPPHISTYCLSYEAGTPIFQYRDQACDDDVLLDLYHQAEDTLKDYAHYEISNFARPGHTCRHNLLYWRNEEYAGFGPGAYSYIEHRRMRNTPHLATYLAQPGGKEETIEIFPYEQQLETLIQHLRLREGIHDTIFRSRFGVSFMDVFSEPITALIRRGLVRHEQGRLWPTREGFYLNNEIGLALVECRKPVAGATGTSHAR